MTINFLRTTLSKASYFLDHKITGKKSTLLNEKLKSAKNISPLPPTTREGCYSRSETPRNWMKSLSQKLCNTSNPDRRSLVHPSSGRVRSPSTGTACLNGHPIDKLTASCQKQLNTLREKHKLLCQEKKLDLKIFESYREDPGRQKNKENELLEKINKLENMLQWMENKLPALIKLNGSENILIDASGNLTYESR